MIHELKTYQREIISLCEMRWEGTGEFYYDEDRLLASGRDGRYENRVALAVKLKVCQVLMTFKPISPCMLKVTFRIKSGAVTILQAHVPISAVPRKETGHLYNDLQKEIQKVSRQVVLLLIRDVNAKVGSDWNSWA